MAAELPGFTAQVNLSAAEIKRTTDRIISKSRETYDSVAAVPLDKVCVQLFMVLYSTNCFVECGSRRSPYRVLGLLIFSLL